MKNIIQKIIFGVFILMFCSSFCFVDVRATEDEALILHDTSIPESDVIREEGNAQLRTSTFGRARTVTLPASYDARDYGLVTSAKNQSQWNLCWAFHAMSMMETAALKANLVSESVDYSEAHFAYFYYNRVSNPLGNTIGDKNIVKDPSYLDQGGNLIFSINALASRVGAAAESIAPYEAITRENELDNEIAYQDEVVLKDAYYAGDQDNIELMKQSVYQYGSVSIAYGHDKSYYNSSTWAYYCDNPQFENHAVTIVGWDDNYAVSNFNSSCRPSKNGAFIVKNNWGTSWGNQGYFYISYENANMWGFAFDVMPAHAYDNLYEYDGSDGGGYSTVMNGGSIANVYAASANGELAESLEAVQISLDSNYVNYQLDIYTGLTDEKNPTSGKLALTQTGTTEQLGIYTIQLDKAIQLNSGSTYAVVFTLKSANDEPGVYYAVEADAGDESTWYGFEAVTAENQSFCKSSSYAAWKDLNDIGSCARIKALTNNYQSAKITVEDTTAHIEWSTSSGATGYRVYYSESMDQDFKVGYDNLTTSLKADLTGLEHGKTYYIKIAAIGVDGEEKQLTPATSFVTAPEKPSIQSITPGEGSFTIVWENVTGATQYELSRSESLDGTYEIVGRLNGESTSCTDKELKGVYTYYYRLRAVRTMYNNSSYSEWSDIKSAGTLPYAPGIQSVQGDVGKITLIWSKADGVNQYEISRASSSGGTFQVIASVNADVTNYTNTGLETGKTYYYKVRSCAGNGTDTIYSSWSGAKYGSTSMTTPTIVSAAGGTAKATIKWNPVSYATGYIIYAMKSGGSYVQMKTVTGQSAASATISNLSYASTYYFKVRAYRTSGTTVYSGYSGQKYCGTSTKKPTIKKLYSYSKKIKIKWGNVSGEKKYQVYMATKKNGKYKKVATIGVNKVIYTKTKLKRGKRYYFKVRTYRTVNGKNIYSSFSSIKSAKAK